MSATRTTRSGLLGVLVPVALVATLVGLVTAGASRGASTTTASVAGTAASPVPVEQLPKPAGAARATDLAAGAISRRVRVAPSSIGSRDSRLEIVVGKKHVSFRNGGRVELADGLVAELFLDPYPPSKLRLWLDLQLTRAPNGTPVRNAKATAEYDMELMPHGRLQATAKSVGSGHYLYALEDSMYGAWGHRLRLQVGKRAYELRLVVVTSPS